MRLSLHAAAGLVLSAVMILCLLVLNCPWMLKLRDTGSADMDVSDKCSVWDFFIISSGLRAWYPAITSVHPPSLISSLLSITDDHSDRCMLGGAALQGPLTSLELLTVGPMRCCRKNVFGSQVSCWIWRGRAMSGLLVSLQDLL